MKNNKRKLIQVCAMTFASAFGTLGFVSVHAANSVGLSDVYQMAFMHDAQLAQKRAEFEASKEGIVNAKAELLPKINAEASYFENSFADLSRSGDKNKKDISVSLRQPLFNKGAWYGLKKVESLSDQAKNTLQNAEQELIIRVVETYFNVLLAEEDVTLSKAQEESDKLQWDRALASAEVGLGSRSDVLQAKSSYDLTKSTRISNENDLDVAYEELMKLTGRSITALNALEASANLPSETFIMENWVERSEDMNFGVKDNQFRLNQANKEIDIQKSAHWFSAELQARVFSSDNDYDVFGADKTDNAIGVVVSVPLYAGGGTSAKVSEARLKQTSAQEALRDSRDQARLDVRIQVRSVERGALLIGALREAVKSNSSFLEAAEEGYKVGLKNLLEVLTARSNLFNAQRDLIEAMHNQVLNRLNLEATVGDLTAEDLIQYDALLSAQN